jgi:hypothetical protein
VGSPSTTTSPRRSRRGAVPRLQARAATEVAEARESAAGLPSATRSAIASARMPGGLPSLMPASTPEALLTPAVCSLPARAWRASQVSGPPLPRWLVQAGQVNGTGLLAAVSPTKKTSRTATGRRSTSLSAGTCLIKHER